MSDTLSEQQRAVVASRGKHQVVVAGPGAGKTKTVVQRILALVADGVAPETIAAITFTNAGADELTSRLKCPHCDDDGMAETGRTAEVISKSLCQHCRGVGRLTLNYCGTLHGLMLRVVRSNHALAGYAAPPTVASEEQAEAEMQEVYDGLRIFGVSLTAMARELASPTVRGRNPTKLQQLADAYRLRMREAGLIDFDAILDRGAEVLRKDAEALNSLRHVMVDEAQDSSAKDWEIYRLIAERRAAPEFCFVGDPDQAIYSFRGGSVEEFVRLAGDDPILAFAGRAVRKLEGNYRCGEEVCAAAQRLIEHNVGRVAKRTYSATGRKARVEVVHHRDEREDLEALAVGVRTAMQASIPEAVAVLCRTNWLARRLALGLKSYSIPVSETKVSGTPRDWRTAKALVAAFADPHNSALALHYLRQKSGSKAASFVKATADKQLRAVTLFDCGVARDDAPTDSASLDFALMSQDVSKESRARVHELRSRRSCDSFQDLVLIMAREDSEPGRTSGIHVGTIHSAKGREFDHVFVCGLEEGLLPVSSAMQNDAAVEEERRLLYVAITRGRFGVTLMSSGTRKPPQPEWAQPVDTDVSRFVNEVKP